MAFVGPFTLVSRVVARLNSIGWSRAAGNLAFTTLLGLVPIATVAFTIVAQFPVFQDFVRVLENYLLRYMLPQDASALVQTYVVGLATEAASLRGLWIVFVIVTAVLVVDAVESEINAIWGIRKKRPLMRRILVYTVGVTAGPIMIGAAIMLIRWLLAQSIAAVSIQEGGIETLRIVVPFLITVAFFTLLYRVAPARDVKWRYALVSGLMAAIAAEVIRRGFAWYVANSPTYEILYGALAAFPIFLLWIFIFWMVVLAGAAVTASLADAGRP
ncbi:MAG: YihY family inner membrane protein [Burkholderiales bacterium]